MHCLVNVRELKMSESEERKKKKKKCKIYIINKDGNILITSSKALCNQNNNKYKTNSFKND